MLSSADVAHRIRLVADRKNIKYGDLLTKCGINTDLLSTMKGSYPRLENIAKIADELDISLDFLTGRSEDGSAMSYIGDFTKRFCELLEELIPNLDSYELEEVGIQKEYLYELISLKKN